MGRETSAIDDLVLKMHLISNYEPIENMDDRIELVLIQDIEALVQLMLVLVA
jgi:hypothetical protein